MKTPFKFLDAYGPEDKAAFFGRDEEVSALYDMVSKNRLILIYGQSGTGKTSLVQCGLASRFDATDWLPVFIRRQQDINQSLNSSLKALSDLPAGAGLDEQLDDIYCTYLRPVYLIFDQLEELFVLGSQAEQQAFTHQIRLLLRSSTPSRVLFIMREEYLAFLYDMEQQLPDLFDRRLRVEPMGRTKLRQVLAGSFRQFNIQAEAPEDDTLDQVVAQVSGKSLVQLPFLQVWLDRFYRSVWTRQYPGQELVTGQWPALAFKRAEIHAFGDLGDVLEHYLADLSGSLNAELKSRFSLTEEDPVRSLLEVFVSEEGTKRPLPYEWKAEALHIKEPWRDLLGPLSPAVLGFICRSLEQARLLRFTEEYVELAHDTLAAYIHSTRSQQQRRLQEIYLRVKYNYRDFQETGEYLSRRQLNALEEYYPSLVGRLDPAVLDFIKESQLKQDQIEQAELLAERRKRRLAIRIATIVGLLAVVAVVAAGFAYTQYRSVERAQYAILQNALEARLGVAKILKVQGQYPEALAELDAARVLAADISAGALEEVVSTEKNWKQVKNYVDQGRLLSADESLRAAISQYDTAYAMAPDTYLEKLRQATQAELENKFADYMQKGQALLNAGQKELAKLNFDKALLLKPESEQARRKAEESNQKK